MNDWEKLTSWQEFLRTLMEDPQEKRRLLERSGLSKVTLERWIKLSSVPHEKNLRKLLQALPPAAARTFVHLVDRAFPGLALAYATLKQVHEQIPSEFYTRLLSARAEFPAPLDTQVIRDLLFQQMLAHLDPEQLGMAIRLTCFVRPLDGSKVRSLREVGGIGTPPWSRDLGQRPVLLGAESLPGYAVSQAHRVIVPHRLSSTFCTVPWAEHEQSAIAVPILLHGERIAGCLMATSAVPEYFLEAHPPAVIFECYAHLATLLFETREWYGFQQIELGYMPPPSQQEPYVREFNHLVSQQFRLAQVRGGYSVLEEARQRVWQEIEAALLQAFLDHPVIE